MITYFLILFIIIINICFQSAVITDVMMKIYYKENKINIIIFLQKYKQANHRVILLYGQTVISSFLWVINKTARANGRWSAVRKRIFWSYCFLIRKAYSSGLIDKQIFGPQNVPVRVVYFQQFLIYFVVLYK